MLKKILLSSALAVSLFASSLNIGDSLPNLTIQDQFEKKHTLDTNIKTVIFTASKDESSTIKDFINEKGKKNFLNKNHIVYVADITAMPSLITKFFALPKMKKYEFPILLVEEKDKDKFPQKEDKISIITLENGKITKVDYLETISKLNEFFR